MRRLKVIVAFVAPPILAALLLASVARVYTYLYCTDAGVSVVEAEALARADAQRLYPQLPSESWVAVERFDTGPEWWILLSSGPCSIDIEINACGGVHDRGWPADSSCPPESW